MTDDSDSRASTGPHERAISFGPATGEMVLHYQPIYSLRDSVVVSVEALVRWSLPGGTFLGAPTVLAQATTPAQRLELDLAVLRRACTDAVTLIADHADTGLHALNVNITPSTLTYPDLDTAVLQILDETGLAPEHLRLEVPETAAFEDIADATGALTALTARGVSLTLDDVGVEAVGLRYLKQLTIDGLKIDRTFVARMLGHASDLAIVRLLVDLCTGLDIRLTAEGIERCEQVQVARRLGVRAIQGFHLSYPVPLQALPPLLRGGITRICTACFETHVPAGWS
jgi:EAL domain-containing protein (putative c-di-GMP-specific phosphodiesterase class I)